MSKSSPLLSLLAVALIIGSPIVYVLQHVNTERNSDPLQYGIHTKARIEAKTDSTGKDVSGNNVSFIYVSYRISPETIPDTLFEHDSLYMDSIAAMRRMMIAENFKIDIPGIKYSSVPVAKGSFEKLHEGDSVKVIYSASEPGTAELEPEIKPEVKNSSNSVWTGACIMGFIFGIGIMVMNKRRRKQEQVQDQTSDLISYSTIKKKDPTSGGAPGA